MLKNRDPYQSETCSSTTKLHNCPASVRTMEGSRGKPNGASWTVKTLSSRQQHLKEYWRGLDIGWSKVEECTRGVEAAGVFRPVTTDPAG